MSTEATSPKPASPERKAPSPLRSAGALHKTPWPHAPLHQLSQSGTYFVTAGTYQKQHHFRGKERLRVLHRGLLTVARDFGWQLEAWAGVFQPLPLRRPLASGGRGEPLRDVASR